MKRQPASIYGPCVASYLAWTPSRIIEWAGTIGPFTARLSDQYSLPPMSGQRSIFIVAASAWNRFATPSGLAVRQRRNLP